MAAHAAGILVSAMVAGALLGLAGSVVGGVPRRTAAVVVGALGLVLVARDLGVLGFPVPQLPRQTKKTWRHRFSPTVAAWLWGLDLGSGLTTLVSYAAYWLLPAAALLSGRPLYGIAVLGCFGLGRASGTLVAATALRADRGLQPAHLLELWHSGARMRRVHVVSAAGLCVLVGAVGLVSG